MGKTHSREVITKEIHHHHEKASSPKVVYRDPPKPPTPPPPPKPLDKFKFKQRCVSDSPQTVEEAVREMRRGMMDMADTGIGSVGVCGVGKSTFLNTVASGLSGDLQQVAAVAAAATTVTKDWRAHHIFDEDGKQVKWPWVDIPGDVCQNLLDIWEVHAKVKDPALLNQAHADADKVLEDKVIAPFIALGVGCLLVVVSALDVMDIQAEESGSQGGQVVHNHLKVLRDLHTKANDSSMRIVCIMTHVDEVDEKVREDMANICHSQIVHDLRKLVCREVGLAMNQVCPVANLVGEADPADNPRLCFMAMKAICTALAAGRCAMLERRTPVVTPAGAVDAHRANDLPFRQAHHNSAPPAEDLDAMSLHSGSWVMNN